MSVLIDTSVWVDHFRNGNAVLLELLQQDLVLTHPLVILELTCGTPPAPRTRTLGNIGLLQPCRQATFSDVAEFVEREKLYRLGCGAVDLSLLASALITPGTSLWTLDRRLGELAARFSVAHRPRPN